MNPVNSNSGFQIIKTWDEAAPFAGMVVAYQTDSLYFGANRGYTIENTHFGYVSETPIISDAGEKGSEVGYILTKVVKFNDKPDACALTASKLVSQISMRLATEEEAKLIKRAITTDQAKLEYMFDKEQVQEIFNRHISSI